MTFRERVLVKPGGVIEITHPDLPIGKEVDVVVTLDPSVEGQESALGAAPKKPIWEIALEIGSSVPESEWAKVPKDLAENLDHYLYGAHALRPGQDERKP